MKNITLLLITILFGYLHAQAQSNIGIRTSLPNEALHVDSGNVRIGNVPWSSSIDDRFFKIGDGDFITIGESDGDDILTLKARAFLFKPSPGYTGNVGIGINNIPTARLELGGSFKYTDGSQAAGKVLTSDASGNATWQTVPAPPSLALKVCIAVGGIYPSFGGGGFPLDDTYLGEIKVFPYSNVPNGWLECNGQLLLINQNTALFSLLGTQYGGDGFTNFALPNLTAIGIIGQ